MNQASTKLEPGDTLTYEWVTVGLIFIGRNGAPLRFGANHDNKLWVFSSAAQDADQALRITELLLLCVGWQSESLTKENRVRLTSQTPITPKTRVIIPSLPDEDYKLLDSSFAAAVATLAQRPVNYAKGSKVIALSFR